jgi:hypothetical protein
VSIFLLGERGVNSGVLKARKPTSLHLLESGKMLSTDFQALRCTRAEDKLSFGANLA